MKELTLLSKYKGNQTQETEENKINETMLLKIRENIKNNLDNFLDFNFEGLIPKIDLNELKKNKK